MPSADEVASVSFVAAGCWVLHAGGAAGCCCCRWGRGFGSVSSASSWESVFSMSGDGNWLPSILSVKARIPLLRLRARSLLLACRRPITNAEMPIVVWQMIIVQNACCTCGSEENETNSKLISLSIRNCTPFVSKFLSSRLEISFKNILEPLSY